MSIIVRALTTDDVDEIQDCLNLLKVREKKHKKRIFITKY